MKPSRLFLFFLATTLLAACDSATLTGDSAAPAPTGQYGTISSEVPTRTPSELLDEAALEKVAVCHSTKAGGVERIAVMPSAVALHLKHGDELAGGAVLDANCAPQPVAASCPCFSAKALSDEFAGAVPTPYLFFDAYQYYGEDPRRTEIRATLSTPAGLREEIAAIYITPTGSAADPLAPICFRQDVTAHPVTGEAEVVYETLQPTIAEAEACRREIVAFAGTEEPCQGAACGLPYTDAHLDPDYAPYHGDGFRTPEPILDALQARIDAVRRRLAPEA